MISGRVTRRERFLRWNLKLKFAAGTGIPKNDIEQARVKHPISTKSLDSDSETGT